MNKKWKYLYPFYSLSPWEIISKLTISIFSCSTLVILQYNVIQLSNKTPEFYELHTSLFIDIYIDRYIMTPNKME